MSGPGDWGSWTSFGFPPVGLAVYERMAIAQNQDGHLELFVVGSEGAVWHRWQAQDGSWSEWASFGQPDGVSFAVQFVSPIQVEQNDDGRLELVLVGSDGQFWHIWQVVPNANWSEWASLGSPGISSLGLNSFARNADAALEVLVSDNVTGDIWSIRQVDASGRSGWVANWSSLGSPPGQPFVPAIRSFQAVRNVNNQLEVLAIGSDGALWHDLKSASSTWQGWRSIGNPPDATGLNVIESIEKNQDGRLEAVCSDNGQNYWHTWQVFRPTGDIWSGFWDNFGQPTGGGGLQFEMRLDSDGLLEALDWGSDYRTYVIHQTAPNNGWSGWSVLSSDITISQRNAIVMSQDQRGRLEAFSHGSGDVIWHIAQVR